MENNKILTDSFIKKGTERMFINDYLKLFGIPTGLLLVIAIIFALIHPVTTPEQGNVLTKIQAPLFFYSVVILAVILIVCMSINFWGFFPKKRKHFVQCLRQINKTRSLYLQKVLRSARKEIIENGKSEEGFFKLMELDSGYILNNIAEPFETNQELFTLFESYVKTLVFLAELNIEYEKKKALLVGEVSPREAEILVETIRANLLVTIQKRKEVDEKEKEISQFITERQQLYDEIERYMYPQNVLIATTN